MHKNLQEMLLKCVHGQDYNSELQTVTNFMEVILILLNLVSNYSYSQLILKLWRMTKEKLHLKRLLSIFNHYQWHSAAFIHRLLY